MLAGITLTLACKFAYMNLSKLFLLGTRRVLPIMLCCTAKKSLPIMLMYINAQYILTYYV